MIWERPLEWKDKCLQIRRTHPVTRYELNEDQPQACHTEATNARDKKKTLKASSKVRGWNNIRIRPGSGTGSCRSCSKNTRQPRIYGTFYFKGTNLVAIPHSKFSEKAIQLTQFLKSVYLGSKQVQPRRVTWKIKRLSVTFVFLSTEAQHDTFEN